MVSEQQRPEQFRFDIASGVLESLGLNMYTSIGKSLSEFVANSYDAEASLVEITIPFGEIEKERALIRERAKAEVKEGKRDKFTALVDPLPDTIKIVVKDHGHGMSPQDIEQKFLIVSRNRREASQKSESNLRYVMGRKGLGKLAGFGTAEKITIRSKRHGESFATEFTMDYGEIKKQEKVHESFFKASYIEDQAVDEKGTIITLSGLRCDSLKASAETVREILAQNFAIVGETFEVRLNGTKVEETPAEHEFIYPDADARDTEGFGSYEVEVSDMLKFPIRYLVRFRARETDAAPAAVAQNNQAPALKRGNLPTALRGARIYCNRRLAAGPSLLKLHTGMHNFHSQAYMECVVHADEIDRQAVDHIGTNRADLKGDSDVVEALRDAVTEIMRLALYEHSKFRDQIIVQQVEQDEFTKGLLTRISDSPKGIRSSTKRLLQTLAASAGVNSELYKAAAPLVLESMNAGEVLSNLIQLESDPKSLVVVAHELFALARVENRDVLKLYRGRRHGIAAVRKLIEQARASWKKGARFENDLHKTLKENPWLIKPEFSRYLTSDQPLGDVAKEIANTLKIDEKSPDLAQDVEGNIVDEDNRPDLVFAMSDSNSPSTISIVELKTPNYPLRMEHLTQLKGYIMRVENWLKAKYPHQVVVRGFLIGDTDETSKSESVQLLNLEKLKAGPLSQWEIITLPDLLDRAKKTHLDAIEALEKYEEFFDDELSVEKTGD